MLPRSHALTAAILGGDAAIKTWFIIELPEVHNSRVDLVGETLDGELIHIEVHSTNHEAMALRMAEYWLRLVSQVRQGSTADCAVLRRRALRMEREFNRAAMHFSYTLIDVPELDARLRSAASRAIGGEEGGGASPGATRIGNDGNADSVGAAAADGGESA